MKTLFSLLFFLSQFPVYAQKTEQYFDYKWNPTNDVGRARYYSIIEPKDSLWSRQDYFFNERTLQRQGTYRDKETKIAEGRFEYFHSNGQLQSKGSYINGKKHSVWLSFHRNGMMSDSINYDHGKIRGISMGWHENGYPADSSVHNEDGSGIQINWFNTGIPSVAGLYSTDRKMHGKWQFFHRNGNPSSVEIYKAGTLLSKQYYDEQGNPENDTTSKDRNSTFPGGIKAWQNYLVKNLSFPEGYKIDGANKVVVMVSWVVDEEGNVRNVFVSGPFHPVFDRIAENVIKKSPKWNPAISHNRKMKFYMTQPLTFQQQ